MFNLHRPERICRQQKHNDTVDEIRRIARYDEWHNLVDEAHSDDQSDTTPHDSSGSRATIVVKPRR
jgi:hypothetical protein